MDNTDVDSSRLYTQPEEVWQVYQELSSIPNANFTVAAAFGNVHGVYAPGNVTGWLLKVSRGLSNFVRVRFVAKIISTNDAK